MEPVCFFETPVNFYRTLLRHIPEELCSSEEATCNFSFHSEFEEFVMCNWGRENDTIFCRRRLIIILQLTSKSRLSSLFLKVKVQGHLLQAHVLAFYV
jgi:hypothetical protein